MYSPKQMYESMRKTHLLGHNFQIPSTQKGVRGHKIINFLRDKWGQRVSYDQKAGRQSQGLIHFSGPESIKHESRLEPSSSDPYTNQVVNIKQQPESVNPEKGQ